MRVSIIAAMDENRLIGSGNALPWQLPADLAHFRKVTLGHPVIMGSNTYKSLPKRPLPGRVNIVLSHSMPDDAETYTVARSLDEALELAGDADEVFIIGGASVYAQALPRATRMYLTLIQSTFSGDTYFPEVDEGEWREIERESHKRDERNSADYDFVIVEKK